MTNKVWVTWKDSISGADLFDKVTNLHDSADISDLRRAFVKQHEPDVRRPATLIVSTKEGKELKANLPLKLYFQNNEDTAPCGDIHMSARKCKCSGSVTAAGTVLNKGLSCRLRRDGPWDLLERT